MLKFMVWNVKTGKYENLPREDVVDIITPGAVEFLEMALMPEEYVEPRPEDCICPPKAFEVYGCMCGKRRMPG